MRSYANKFFVGVELAYAYRAACVKRSNYLADPCSSQQPVKFTQSLEVATVPMRDALLKASMPAGNLQEHDFLG